MFEDMKNMNKRFGMAKFTVDSKGNVKKNFKNGGNVSKSKVVNDHLKILILQEVVVQL
jgi:hypothetical protein